MRGCNVEGRDIILERYMKMKFLQKNGKKSFFGVLLAIYRLCLSCECLWLGFGFVGLLVNIDYKK